MEFYRQNIDALIQQFNSNVQRGLDENSIQSARKKFGKNILKASNTKNVFQILLRQFTGPLIIILVVASLLSFYLQQPRDGLILLMIVVANALIGFLRGVEIRKYPGIYYEAGG
jgi:magnesium-transporting ATPase (P-type)